MFWTLMAALLAGLIGLVIYLYYMYQGQFEDCEDVKYQLFRNDDE